MRIRSEPSTDPKDFEFSHRVRVRFAETDAMGIVHHSRYLPMMEETRVEYLRHIGQPYDKLREDGSDMPVLEAFLRYRQPLRFDDIVQIHLTVLDVTRTAFQMGYLLTVEDVVCATAVTAHGCLNPEGKPTRLPPWMADLAPD